MWYFTWALGIGFAVSFSIFIAMWYEFHHTNSTDKANLQSDKLPSDKPKKY